MSLMLATGFLALLPILLAMKCVEHGAMGGFNNAVMDMTKMECAGQQCYQERDENDVQIQYYRDCISGIEMKDGCTKYVIAGYSVVRCYCRSADFCNMQDITQQAVYTTVNTTAVQCAREPQDYCLSYECLYVGQARQCQNSVDEFTPHSSWLGYLWQNTCLHHRTQSGQIESDCRCNTTRCNEFLPDRSENFAMNETYRSRPLVKCHFSFEIGGVASDKYFCIGELCALSEGKGVRTCVNVTDLGGAEPIKKLGLIDFDNRTYYLCEKPFCNWNGSVAIASQTFSWKSSDNETDLKPFEENSASIYHLILPIFMSLMLWARDF